MKRAIGTVVQSTTSRHLPSLRFEGSGDFRLAVLEAGFKPGDVVEIVRHAPESQACTGCGGELGPAPHLCIPRPTIPLAERVEQLTAAADRLRKQVQELETVKAENTRLSEWNKVKAAEADELREKLAVARKLGMQDNTELGEERRRLWPLVDAVRAALSALPPGASSVREALLRALAAADNTTTRQPESCK